MAALDWDDPVNVNEPEPGFLLGRGHGRGLDSNERGHQTSTSRKEASRSKIAFA
jgi:hypothetical protein